MYDYVSLNIKAVPASEDIYDLMAAFLAEHEFESFVQDNETLTAYIRKDKYDQNALEEVIKNFPMDVVLTYTEEDIIGEDWNHEWEKNYFKPIKIGDRILVRSSFHDSYPETEIEILIDPKMAFGTGHHATTAGMSRLLLEEDMKGKHVIDMGTGTGILSILAKKLGAGETVGIDIDEFAIENARENGEMNRENIKWLVGDDKTLEGLSECDIFLANINLNVITENLAKYVSKLKTGGCIFLSGFLEGDRERMLEETGKYGLVLNKEKSDNGWLAMKFDIV